MKTRNPIILLIATFAVAFYFLQIPEAKSPPAEPIQVDPFKQYPKKELIDEGENFKSFLLKPNLPCPRKCLFADLGSQSMIIDFGSPKSEGRQLFGWGGVVPWGVVWQAGDDEATTIRFKKSFVVNGKLIQPGTYCLFTIPGADSWEIILNDAPSGTWGSEYLKVKNKDIIRYSVKPFLADRDIDAMCFIVEKGDILLAWGRYRIPLQFGTA